MKFIAVLMALVLAYGKIYAEMNYDKLNAKAERFVQFQEWNSANAMYLLMLDRCQAEAKPYSRAIVTSGLLGDDNAQLELLERTQKNSVPLDSVFSNVRDFSFEIGESQEYEQFFRLVKNRHSWLARPINVRLLNYYDFRNDAVNMVAVGKELLVATPDDIGYLDAVARGYMLMGDFENGAITYDRILSVDDRNYDALIAMGNYFYAMWKSSEGTRSQMSADKEKALEYLQRANELRSTPYVTAVIEELSK